MTVESLNKHLIITNEIIEGLKGALVSENLISSDKLQAAESIAINEKESLGKILIKSEFIGEEQLLNFISQKIHIPYVNLLNYSIDPRLIERIPEKISRHYIILPLFEIENILTLAISNPLDIRSLDDISKVVRCKIEPVLASEESIKAAIDQWYGAIDGEGTYIDKIIEEFEDSAEKNTQKQKYAEKINEARLRKEAEEAPIVKLVNSIIVKAILEGASDIHIEPLKDAMEVRYRIDGFLYTRNHLPQQMLPAVISRIKILSGMDIAQRRLPQDGRINLIVQGRSIDLRTSTFPTLNGEKSVLRVLDKGKGLLKLSELGFSERDLDIFQNLLTNSHGILLAAGPTGSGKTTTNLSALGVLNQPNRNIMTIEDPIEYEIEGIIQAQINPKINFTFANALKSMLRQDPDIIYIGEIRDSETAQIVIRASLTGHLVLSSIHANDAVGAITRLRDMGIGNGLISYSLKCTYAQRLVRKICLNCRYEYLPNENQLSAFGLAPGTKLYRGKGCASCNGVGYKGRISLFEVLRIDKQIARLIKNKASEDEIMESAQQRGMKTLFEDGLQKVVSIYRQSR